MANQLAARFVVVRYGDYEVEKPANFNGCTHTTAGISGGAFHTFRTAMDGDMLANVPWLLRLIALGMCGRLTC